MRTITRQDIANTCDADVFASAEITGPRDEVVARSEITVAELIEANARLEGTSQVSPRAA